MTKNTVGQAGETAAEKTEVEKTEVEKTEVEKTEVEKTEVEKVGNLVSGKILPLPFKFEGKVEVEGLAVNLSFPNMVGLRKGKIETRPVANTTLKGIVYQILVCYRNLASNTYGTKRLTLETALKGNPWVIPYLRKVLGSVSTLREKEKVNVTATFYSVYTFILSTAVIGEVEGESTTDDFE